MNLAGARVTDVIIRYIYQLHREPIYMLQLQLTALRVEDVSTSSSLMSKMAGKSSDAKSIDFNIIDSANRN